MLLFMNQQAVKDKTLCQSQTVVGIRRRQFRKVKSY